MKSFDGISFWWALIGGAVLALILGVRSWLSYRQVRADAKDDYSYKTQHGMIPVGLSQTEYEAIYERVHAPRAQLHMFIGLVAILIATPIAMLILEQGLNLIYNLSGQSRVIEPGFLVWQFFIFFGLLFTWVGIAYLVARRYHSQTPGSLQFEIDQHLYAGTDYGERF
ncbi:hypothetical protein [Litorimonas sp. WD9-15]|uniref:hypothetical protein n=1 Tax=Litorimonas sp. WD9-15 TaxID=3418716 RepID=UPI003D05DCEA